MRRKMKKLLVGLACLSMMNVQTSIAAEMVQTGTVFGTDSKPTANIESFEGAYKGFVRSDDNLTTDIYFNNTGNTAVINWGKLNVGAKETLNFNNNGVDVLNNVQNGMSTFAGAITSGTGALIISNPNGMLMKSSGSINAGGALVLTTQNCLDKTVEQAMKASDAAKAVTALCGKVHAAGDIVIYGAEAGSLAGTTKSGIYMEKADITSDGAIKFETTDGSNFIARLGSKVTSNNGTDIKAGVVGITASTVKGPLKVDASEIAISSSSIGDAILNSTKYVYIHNKVNGAPSDNSVFGDVKISAGTYADIMNSDFNSIDLVANDSVKIENVNVQNDTSYVSNHGSMVINGGSYYGDFTAIANKEGDGAQGYLAVGAHYSVANQRWELEGVWENDASGVAQYKVAKRPYFGGKVSTSSATDTVIMADERIFDTDGNVLSEGTLNLVDCTAGRTFIGNTYGNIIAENIVGNTKGTSGDGAISASTQNVVGGISDAIDTATGRPVITNEAMNVPSGNVYLQATGTVTVVGEAAPGTVIQEGIDPDMMNQEAEKILNTLSQSGVNTNTLGTDFTPVAFAAHDDGRRNRRANSSSTIYKDQENVIHILERTNLE